MANYPTRNRSLICRRPANILVSMALRTFCICIKRDFYIFWQCSNFKKHKGIQHPTLNWFVRLSVISLYRSSAVFVWHLLIGYLSTILGQPVVQNDVLRLKGFAKEPSICGSAVSRIRRSNCGFLVFKIFTFKVAVADVDLFIHVCVI